MSEPSSSMVRVTPITEDIDTQKVLYVQETLTAYSSMQIPFDEKDEVPSLSAEIKPAGDETERTNQRRRFLYFTTLCFCFFFEGWSDGSFGPLLPRLQSAYGVSEILFSCVRKPETRPHYADKLRGCFLNLRI